MYIAIAKFATYSIKNGFEETNEVNRSIILSI